MGIRIIAIGLALVAACKKKDASPATQEPSNTTSTSGGALTLTGPDGPPDLEAQDPYFDFAGWLRLDGFPAVSADATQIATVAINYAGYDQLGVAIAIDDLGGDAAETIELLTEDDIVKVGGDEQARQALPATVSPRLEKARARLATTRWLPLEVLQGEFGAPIGKTAAGEDIVVAWEEPTLTVTIGQTVVHAEAHPEWKAVENPPCKDDEYGNGCGCRYAFDQPSVVHSAELGLLRIGTVSITDHQCEDPPETPSFVLRYPK